MSITPKLPQIESEVLSVTRNTMLVESGLLTKFKQRLYYNISKGAWELLWLKMLWDTPDQQEKFLSRAWQTSKSIYQNSRRRFTILHLPNHSRRRLLLEKIFEARRVGSLSGTLMILLQIRLFLAFAEAAVSGRLRNRMRHLQTNHSRVNSINYFYDWRAWSRRLVIPHYQRFLFQT